MMKRVEWHFLMAHIPTVHQDEEVRGEGEAKGFSGLEVYATPP